MFLLNLAYTQEAAERALLQFPAPKLDQDPEDRLVQSFRTESALE